MAVGGLSMNAIDYLVKEAKQNQSWEILKIIKSCETIEEAAEKIEAMIEQLKK
jgi:hypothetical protein